MFRPVHDALVRLFTRPRTGGHAVSDWELSLEVRVPDPYVWRLPDPSEARWRRWARRSRAAGHRLPFPRDEECWHLRTLPTRPGRPRWDTADDMVRLYVVPGPQELETSSQFNSATGRPASTERPCHTPVT